MAKRHYPGILDMPLPAPPFREEGAEPRLRVPRIGPPPVDLELERWRDATREGMEARMGALFDYYGIRKSPPDWRGLAIRLAVQWVRGFSFEKTKKPRGRPAERTWGTRLKFWAAVEHARRFDFAGRKKPLARPRSETVAIAAVMATKEWRGFAADTETARRILSSVKRAARDGLIDRWLWDWASPDLWTWCGHIVLPGAKSEGSLVGGSESDSGRLLPPPPEWFLPLIEQK